MSDNNEEKKNEKKKSYNKRVMVCQKHWVGKEKELGNIVCVVVKLLELIESLTHAS